MCLCFDGVESVERSRRVVVVVVGGGGGGDGVLFVDCGFCHQDCVPALIIEIGLVFRFSSILGQSARTIPLRSFSLSQDVDFSECNDRRSNTVNTVVSVTVTHEPGLAHIVLSQQLGRSRTTACFLS